jgi:hypothetical protein|tara:strand:+ start:236 stop:355 length:120 start_codon:yes stop_codon:yes gene_type:complete
MNKQTDIDSILDDAFKKVFGKIPPKSLKLRDQLERNENG